MYVPNFPKMSEKYDNNIYIYLYVIYINISGIYHRKITGVADEINSW